MTKFYQKIIHSRVLLTLFSSLCLSGCLGYEDISLNEQNSDENKNVGIQTSPQASENNKTWQNFVSQDFFLKKEYPKKYQELSPQPKSLEREKPLPSKTAFYDPSKNDCWAQYVEKEKQSIKLKK